MAFKKSHLFPEQDRILSNFFRSLSHPARVGILKELSHLPEATVDTLSRHQPLSRPTYSEHLHILRQSHLVTFKEKFPNTYYSLDRKTRDKMKKLIYEFLKSI